MVPLILSTYVRSGAVLCIWQLSSHFYRWGNQVKSNILPELSQLESSRDWVWTKWLDSRTQMIDHWVVIAKMPMLSLSLNSNRRAVQGFRHQVRDLNLPFSICVTLGALPYTLEYYIDSSYLWELLERLNTIIHSQWFALCQAHRTCPVHVLTSLSPPSLHQAPSLGL